MPNKQNAGYTIIEMVVVITILAIVVAATSVMFTREFESYFESRNLTNTQEGALFALVYITEDLQDIRSPNDISTAAANQIVFINDAGNTITYAVSANQLTRNDGTSTQVVAKNVQSFTLTYYDVNGVVTATLANIRYINVALNVQLGYDAISKFNVNIYPRF